MNNKTCGECRYLSDAKKIGVCEKMKLCLCPAELPACNNFAAKKPTRPIENAKDKEIERLKVHCNALHDCLFVLQKMHEELMGNDELSEDAKDAQLEVVTNIVKVLATARFHGIKGTICPNCESQDCSNCDIDTIMAIQERIANAPDSTKGVKK